MQIRAVEYILPQKHNVLLMAGTAQGKTEAAFLPATQSLIARIEAISKAMAHRPFNPQSEAYRRFCQQQLEEIEKIRLTCPKADFRKEDEFFAQYL
jgi:CRISPR/Cas system-associated endonuclease/helicase Cas3